MLGRLHGFLASFHAKQQLGVMSQSCTSYCSPAALGPAFGVEKYDLAAVVLRRVNWQMV
jgi:hypothetical protein